MQKCLARDPKSRPDVAQLFNHPFLNNNKDKLTGTGNKLQYQQPRPPITARAPAVRNRILEDFGSELNNLTPRRMAHIRNV